MRMKRFLILLAALLTMQAHAVNFPMDFSRVGYMWGEKPIPDYPTLITLAPLGEEDATAMIQNALDEVPSGGAVLLKEGVYKISGALVMNRSDVVLRGEGENTVLIATGKGKRSFITLGKNTERKIQDKSRIIADYTPAGQMWVKVQDPSMFAVGDHVTICLTPNDEWIHGLKMDQIAQNKEKRVKQWKASQYVLRWERIVVGVKGNKVWLDNPVAMELDSKYMHRDAVKHGIEK